MDRLIHFQCKGRRKMSGVTCSVTSKLRLAVFLTAAVVMLQGIDAQAESFPAGFSVDSILYLSQSSNNLTDGELTLSIIEESGAAPVTSVWFVDPSTGKFDLIAGVGDGMSSLLTGDGGGVSVALRVAGEAPADSFVFAESVMGFRNDSPLPMMVTIKYERELTAFATGNAISDSGITVWLDSGSSPPPPDDIFIDQVNQPNRLISNLEGVDWVLGEEQPHSDVLLVYSGDHSVDLFIPAWDDLYLGFMGVLQTWATGSSFTGSLDFGITVTDVQVVPVPGAVLLGSIGLGFAGWKLRRRKEL